MEEERKQRISIIDKGSDLLKSSLDNLSGALALFLTGWFTTKLILGDGNIEDSQENYNALNQLDEAKAAFFTESVVPFLVGISLVFWDITQLNKKYFASIEGEANDDLSDGIVDAISTAFGFKITDDTVELAPGGWLVQIGDLTSIYQKVRESAMKAVGARMPLVDFLKILKTEIIGDNNFSGMVQSHFRTIVWDVYAQYDRMVGYKFAIGLGYRAAIYEGGLIDHSRPFCIVRNGEVFTFDEITKFGTPEDKYDGYSNKSIGMFDGKPKFDYDPFFDQGGHNCRHAYSYIPDRLAIHLRPELKQVLHA